jgi:hypothetical protein
VTVAQHAQQVLVPSEPPRQRHVQDEREQASDVQQDDRDEVNRAERVDHGGGEHQVVGAHDETKPTSR